MNPVTELEDLYPRLFGVLPALSRGKSNENSAGYTAAPDPRRAPVRIEVHDLIAEIERDLPDLARWMCDATGVLRRVAIPRGSDGGRKSSVDPQAMAALLTLRRNWPTFEDLVPTMAAVVVERLGRYVAAARRMIGETAAPIPLVSPCPECNEPTVFRVETEAGATAVCSNPMCRDDFGNRNRWSEIEWEDAHDERHGTAC